MSREGAAGRRGQNQALPRVPRNQDTHELLSHALKHHTAGIGTGGRRRAHNAQPLKRLANLDYNLLDGVLGRRRVAQAKVQQPLPARAPQPPAPRRLQHLRGHGARGVPGHLEPCGRGSHTKEVTHTPQANLGHLPSLRRERAIREVSAVRGRRGRAWLRVNAAAMTCKTGFFHESTLRGPRPFILKKKKKKARGGIGAPLF